MASPPSLVFVAHEVLNAPEAFGRVVELVTNPGHHASLLVFE